MLMELLWDGDVAQEGSDPILGHPTEDGTCAPKCLSREDQCDAPAI